ncbi:MAG: MBL fold metallo-hydrolase [Intrasporangium sp.]|nr:MBL fold metallo-hydrolase [Intrasporangium sp.]
MPLRVHHLNCGTMRPVGGDLVCHCLLIESDDGLVLVDTGFGLQDIARPNRRVGRVLRVLSRPVLDPGETAQARTRALGLDPADVRHIILTHLDSDHAGGLSDFPRATVHVSPRMLANVRPSVPLRFAGRMRAVQWAHGPRWSTTPPYAAELLGLPSAPLPFGGGDLHVVPLEGHVPGHIGVAVRRSEGRTPWLLHVGDASFSHRAFTGDRTPLPLLLSEVVVRTDRRAWSETRTSLSELAQRHTDEVELVCAHDPGGLPSDPSGLDR